MPQFIHKKHIQYKGNHKSKVVIYYNLSDIILGLALLALTIFFASSYIKDHLNDRLANTPSSSFSPTSTINTRAK